MAWRVKNLTSILEDAGSSPALLRELKDQFWGFFFCVCVCVFLPFLGPLAQHTEVPGLGV